MQVEFLILDVRYLTLCVKCHVHVLECVDEGRLPYTKCFTYVQGDYAPDRKVAS